MSFPFLEELPLEITGSSKERVSGEGSVEKASYLLDKSYSTHFVSRQEDDPDADVIFVSISFPPARVKELRWKSRDSMPIEQDGQ